MPLPETLDLRHALERAATDLGLAPEARQIDALLGYVALLQRWNATYNLTSVREPAQMLTLHLSDCLAVVRPLVRELGGADGRRLLDVGSGGGLPGIVLAAMLPTLDVTCVDSVGKKAAFVRQAAGELGLRNLHAEHARVEQLRRAPFDVIVCRAFASLGDFVRLTRHLLVPGGVWMAMKGQAPDEEIAALSADVQVFHVEPLQVPGLEGERCLVWLRKTAATPDSGSGRLVHS